MQRSRVRLPFAPLVLRPSQSLRLSIERFLRQAEFEQLPFIPDIFFTDNVDFPQLALNHFKANRGWVRVMDFAKMAMYLRRQTVFLEHAKRWNCN